MTIVEHRCSSTGNFMNMRGLIFLPSGGATCENSARSALLDRGKLTGWQGDTGGDYTNEETHNLDSPRILDFPDRP